MIDNELIGKNVLHRKSHMIGTIINVINNTVEIDFHGHTSKYIFPTAFSDDLELEDENLQNELEKTSQSANFEDFKSKFKRSINNEINYLRKTGGKHYHVIDGERLPSQNGEYVYAFDTDTELNFPDGTPIKFWLRDSIVSAYVISCEEFTIMIRSMEYIGDKIESLEFTAEQWQLLEALLERVSELNPSSNSIAYEVACKGRYMIDERKTINLGQDYALKRASEESITFIWGPPGTGKTHTLAKIALEFIEQGKRVLMLSYSNVSVDGALLKVANMSDCLPGQIIRYGYPRVKQLLESKTLTSYQFVLNTNPVLSEEYQMLLMEKRKLRNKDVKRVDINKRLNTIRTHLLEQERELIQSAAFVATTVTKAIIDKAIYQQHFDLVIFDEASMAYIPQIIFAASLATTNFICLGDFRQLPAIVQNSEELFLSKDIFEHTGITEAVENGYGHDWLVMLNEQHRMHKEIAEFIGNLMYDGKLVTSHEIVESRQQIANCNPLPSEAMVLFDLSYMYSVCIRTMDGSRINLLSALISTRIAELCVDKYEIGIITPYSAQSRLILAMLRDLQARDSRFKRITSATVHQFQGSEKPIIIYDAVDCFRMSYLGTLLTSQKSNTANRLFNVAITRAEGKLFLVCNRDFMFRKNISKKLIFTEALEMMYNKNIYLEGNDAIDALYSAETSQSEIFISIREDSWGKYIKDICGAMNEIHIDIPGVIDENDEAIKELEDSLEKLANKGVKIVIRKDENITLPTRLQYYSVTYPYVTNPITIIDKSIVWYGQPLSAADFISEGEPLETKYFPCVRFYGKHTARILRAFLTL